MDLAVRSCRRRNALRTRLARPRQDAGHSRERDAPAHTDYQSLRATAARRSAERAGRGRPEMRRVFRRNLRNQYGAAVVQRGPSRLRDPPMGLDPHAKKLVLCAPMVYNHAATAVELEGVLATATPRRRR